MKSMLRLILLGAVIALASCGGNKELKKDAKNIAVAMCRNIETMNKLRAANPADSAKSGIAFKGKGC